LAGDDEKRAELTEHLAELRTRLIRIAIYVVFGAAAAWVSYDQLFAIITHPMTGVLQRRGMKFLLTGFPEAFMIQLQVCIVAGIILMSPLITMEIWGFVMPGLTRQERKTIRWVAPLSILLFLGGVTLCYTILPMAFNWFVKYVPENAELRPAVQASILFTVKMLLAFGIVFELPIVLMILGRIGIVSSRFLLCNWRTAMVAVAVVAAAATPSNDAFTMLVMAVPVAGLYFLSIGLVRLVERKRSR